MILYRAINKNDEESLKKYGEIICTYSHTYKNYIIDCKSEDIKLYNRRNKSNIACWYRIYMLDKRKYVLNGIIGHINGTKLKGNKSPWISTTSDCRFAITEYAVPQSGKYNTSNTRKPIIVIENNKIYKDVEEIKKLRETKEVDFGIDLRNKNLENLFNNDAIEFETTVKDENTKITGFSNFATAANEIIIFQRIKGEDIKLIIYPFIQDIIYACNIDIDKCYKSFIENKKELEQLYNDIYNNLGNYKKIFKELYPTYKEGNNLTDLLIKYFDCLPCDTIENKYEYMKRIKKKILEIVIEEFNKRFKTELKINKLVDEKILVKNTNRISKKEDINDIILIEQNSKLYKFNPPTNEYISDNDEIITKQKIKELTKK